VWSINLGRVDEGRFISIAISFREMFGAERRSAFEKARGLYCCASSSFYSHLLKLITNRIIAIKLVKSVAFV